MFAAFNYTYEHSQLYLVHTGMGAGGREGGLGMYVFSPAADVTMHLHIIDYTCRIDVSLIYDVITLHHFMSHS